MGTRKDAQLLATNTAHTLDMLDLDMLMLDLSDMLSNVKLMLKLTHKFSVMVVSTTDSDMLDFMEDMPTMLSPSPPPSPRPPAHLLSTPSPRSLAKPELPKLSNTPSTPTTELTSDKHFTPKSKNCNLDK